MVKKKVVKKRAAKKKVVAKRGRPAGVSTTKKVTTRKKVATKSSGKSTKPAETASVGRRGRPVSAETVQRKLTAVQQQLNDEKAKRKVLAQSLRDQIKSAAQEKREFKVKLAAAGKQLRAIEEVQRADARALAKQEKLAAARAAAVDKFTEKWEKKFLAAEVKKKPRRVTRKRKVSTKS